MSIVTINMSDYKVERKEPSEAEYGNEVLCTGWNPSLAMQQHIQTEENRPVTIPLELVAVDVELFLKKMYAYQH